MRIILIILFVIVSTCVSATNYYVTPRGNDSNDGADTTSAHAWLTWQKAVNTATVAGDTVFIRGGIYYTTSQVYKYSNSGTRTSPIVFMAYPLDYAAGNYPILDGINKTSVSHGIYFTGVNNIVLTGLTVRNNLQYAVGDRGHGFLVSNGNNIVFRNCTAHNNGYRGFNIYEPDSIYFYNCDAYNNADTLSTSPGNGGDGFNIWNDLHTDSTCYVYLYKCRAWHNSDDGYDTNLEGLVHFDQCWTFNNGYLVGGNGGGFKFGLTEITVSYVTRRFTNCVSAYNIYAGFVTNEESSRTSPGMNIFNNISYHNGYVEAHPTWGWGFAVMEGESSQVQEEKRIFENNISYDNSDGAVMVWPGAYYTHLYNSWDTPPGVTLSDADFLSVDSTGITAARQSDGSLPNNNCYNNFLKLVKESDCVDAGIDVGLPYSGTAPDIGYFESPVFKYIYKLTKPIYNYSTGKQIIIRY